jgi:hypothetical protein
MMSKKGGISMKGIKKGLPGGKVNSPDAFSMMLTYGNIAAELDLPELWKEYITLLTCELCGQDTGLGAAFIKKPELLTGAPLNILEELANSGVFEPGDSPDHPFNLLKSDKTALDKRVWTAQAKVCLPLIEMERNSFISAHYGRLIPIIGTEYWDEKTEKYKELSYHGVDQVLEDPYELDVVSLHKVSLLRKRLVMLNTFSYAAFFNMFPEERERLGFLAGLWKRLNGFKQLLPKEINQLFAGHDDFMNR